VRVLWVGLAVLAACSGDPSDSANETTSTSTSVALADQRIEWQGEQLESTPRELFEHQDDGETVVVANDPRIGDAYVSAIRDGDRLCVTLNASGENAPEDWCDWAAVVTPDELEASTAVGVGTVQAPSGDKVVVAYGWTEPDVTTVRGPDGTEVAVQRNLPFWAYGFFALPIPAEPATLTLVHADGEESPILAGA